MATRAAIGPTMTPPAGHSAAAELRQTAASARCRHTAVCRPSRRSSTWVADLRRRGRPAVPVIRHPWTGTPADPATTAADLAQTTRLTLTSVDLQGRQGHMVEPRRTRRLDGLHRRRGRAVDLLDPTTGTCRLSSRTTAVTHS